MAYSLALPNQNQVEPVVAAPTDMTAGTPEWWVYQLEVELDRRYPLVSLYEDYFQGRHKLSFATAQYRQAFAQMLAAVSDNWIPMIIEAWVERLRPQGFRFGDRTGDEDAWRIFQANNLDALCPTAFTEAGKHGESYLLVWPQEKETAGVFGRFFSRRGETDVRITIEHPSQVVVRRSPVDSTVREAALKRWQESDGTHMATLYLPDKTYRFQRGDGTDSKWEPREGVEHESKNRIGVVPVIPIVNNPQILPSFPPAALVCEPHSVPMVAIGLGRSEQADIISTVDQINKLLCDMMVAAEFGAFKQRWATGLDTPQDPSIGEPVDAWEAAINRVWETPAEGAKFGEFSATDLSNYWQTIKSRIESLAARTRTPPHYILGEITNASGDALKAAETGLASKSKGKQLGFGESLEEAIRIAFAWKGDEKARLVEAETIWAPAESRSESEFVDSLVKKLSIGVPMEQLWRDYGYSPQTIGDFKVMLQEEADRMGVFDLGGGDNAGQSAQPDFDEQIQGRATAAATAASPEA